jgi:hypothetical protein
VACGQVELDERVKPAVIAGVPVRVSGAFPLLTIVRVFGLSVLVLPTAVVANMKEGGVATSRAEISEMNVVSFEKGAPAKISPAALTSRPSEP